MKLLGASWRTSTTGILSLLASLGMGAKLIMASNFNFNDPLWLAVFAGVANGIGLLKARDEQVSTEQVDAVRGPSVK